MNTKTLLIVLISLLVGAGGGYAVANSSSANNHEMSDGTTMSGSVHSDMQGEMDGMLAGLSGKTGDAFDKAFLSEMITHHEGAVGMAEAALKNANHAEIKQMANAIIFAQTTEIQQMKEWLQSWYGQE
jgi:uncharacterized protein (DUF305 family)